MSASEFTLQAGEDKVVLSMDFSPNERTRSKHGNSYLDVQQLKEDASNVWFFQISKEKWLIPLATELKRYPNATRVLELKFKDGASIAFPYELDGQSHNLTFYAVGSDPI